jgi:hypothetical protein
MEKSTKKTIAKFKQDIGMSKTGSGKIRKPVEKKEGATAGDDS